MTLSLVKSAPCNDCGIDTPYDKKHRHTAGHDKRGNPRWRTVCNACFTERSRQQEARDRARKAQGLPGLGWGGPEIDPKPIVRMLAKVLRMAQATGNDYCSWAGKAGVTKEDVLAGCDVTARSFDRWDSGEARVIRFDYADHIIGMSPFLWWEVYDPALYPKVAALFDSHADDGLDYAAALAELDLGFEAAA